MTQNPHTAFETNSNGFLTGIAQEDSHIKRAVLLTARYDTDVYTDSLFETLNIPCPTNIRSAAPKRKADYLAGRAIAYAAMTTLNAQPAPVTTAPSRVPVWPQGLAGSISHARSRCACLLSQDTQHSYGVDTEAIAQGNSLKAILSETLTAKDRAIITQGPLTAATNATLAFSAKEALFKTLYPQVGAFFGFTAAELTAAPTDNSLMLTLTTDLTPNLNKGQSFTCHAQVTTTHVLTWLAVPTP